MSYEKIEQLIISSPQYKRIYFKNQFPEAVQVFKSSLLRFEEFPSLKKIITKITDKKISMVDFYNQLLTEKNIKHLYHWFDYQMNYHNISIEQYYVMSKTLKQLTTIKKSIDRASANKYQELILQTKSIKQFIIKSKIMENIRNELDEFFDIEIKSWKKYKQIKLQLLKNENFSLIEIRDILHKLMPDDDQFKSLGLRFLTFDANDFKGLIEFINENKKIPSELMQTIDEQIRIFSEKRTALGEIDITSELSTVTHKHIIKYDYTKIYADIRNLNKMLGVELEKSSTYILDKILIQSCEFLATAIQHNQDLKNLYLLAHMQEAVGRLTGDLQLIFLSNRIFDLFYKNQFSPEGQSRVANRLITLLLQMTHADFAFSEKIACFTFAQDNIDFPAILRHKYIEIFNWQDNTSEVPDNKSCQKFLTKINAIELKYYHDFIRVLINQDQRKTCLIILRLTALEYIKEMICSEQAITTKKLKENLNTLFTKDVLGLSNFLKNELDSLIEEIDSLFTTKSSSRFGLFRRIDSQPSEQSEEMPAYNRYKSFHWRSNACK